MAVLFKVPPLVTYLAIINVSKLAAIDWLRRRKTLDIHRPKDGEITGVYQCLTHWHIVSAPFGNARFHVNHA